MKSTVRTSLALVVIVAQTRCSITPQNPPPTNVKQITESSTPVSPPPDEAIPKGYHGHFGGWAEEIKCVPTKPCNKPPASPTANSNIAMYTSLLLPEGKIFQGDTAHVCSRIQIVSGNEEKFGYILEGLVLSTQGKEIGRLMKGVSLNGRDGQFQTDFALELPKNTPTGNYRVKTKLYVDKKPVDSHTLTFHISKGSQKITVSCGSVPVDDLRKYTPANDRSISQKELKTNSGLDKAVTEQNPPEQ